MLTKWWLVFVGAPALLSPIYSHPAKGPELCFGRHHSGHGDDTCLQLCWRSDLFILQVARREALVAMMIYLCISLLRFHFCCCNPKPLTNSSLLETGFILAHECRIQWQERQTVGQSYPRSRAEGNECEHARLHSSAFLYLDTVQDPLPMGWCCPQWAKYSHINWLC